ncbi:MAG: hypothetical protein AAFN70_15510, partial [Planctomycetota bacterium]
VDGGGFYEYHKPFHGESIDAVFSFTGSYVPEEDMAAGLISLYFVPLKKNQETGAAWNASKKRLETVPPVLVSECYNDLKDIAAVGTGYDPDWEKKGLY